MEELFTQSTLKKFSVKGCYFIDPPMAILDSGIGGIRDYFEAKRNRQHDPVIEYHQKVFVVGYPAEGKTCLVKAMGECLGIIAEEKPKGLMELKEKVYEKVVQQINQYGVKEQRSERYFR